MWIIFVILYFIFATPVRVLNANSKWKLYTSQKVSVGGSISLPKSYRELYIEVAWCDSMLYAYQFFIPSISLVSDYKYYRCYAETNNGIQQATIKISVSNLAIFSLTYEGMNIGENIPVNIWYK